MQIQLTFARPALAAAAALLLGACSVTNDTSTAKPADSAVAQATPTSQTLPPVAGDSAGGVAKSLDSGAADGTGAGAAAAADTVRLSDVRVEVDLKARQLHVFRGDTKLATHPVAVGSARVADADRRVAHPAGRVEPGVDPARRVVGRGREPKEPGASDNPLGRAQLIYDPPRTVHGTNDPASIGKAVSHGSIRMRNETIQQLAREIQEAGGAGKDEAWYRRARERRTEKQIVDLPLQVPIRVY